MLKKTLVTLGMCLMLMVSVVSAESHDKTMELLDKYQDMRLSCEAGMNKVDYERKYRDLYIATMKLANTLDLESLGRFIRALECYEDAKDIWGYRNEWFYEQNLPQLHNEYPKAKKEVYRDAVGQFYRPSYVEYVIGVANIFEKDLEEKIKEKQQKQEKTAE